MPQDLQTDQTMRHLMGDFAREVARDSGQYRERAGGNPSEYYEYAETGRAYDEYREGDGGGVEYRYADFPLALGEAIMMNHALFTGLLHAGATPITDDPFHSRALALKLGRAVCDPVVEQARAERARQLKLDMLATSALMDPQLDLPVLNSALPLAQVLEYRKQHDADLREARNKLGWMARRIEAEPWTREFADELEHKTIPDLASELDEARKARDGWLESKRGRLALAQGASRSEPRPRCCRSSPRLSCPWRSRRQGWVSCRHGHPGREWLLDWRDGKKSVQENGLHYLLKTS